MHEGSKKAIIAAFLANLGIAIAKLIAFLFTGAASMLAEAIRSGADTANQGLLMLGGRQARRPADEQHPFGYGIRRYFWAFIVSLVLFSLGGLFAIFEGIEKLREPHELEVAEWAIGVLLVAIVLESISFRTAIREGRHLKRSQRSWWQFIRRTKNPELPVVLLEDFAALTGLVFALTGVTLAEVTDEPRWDAAGSLAIGVLLVIVAAVLAYEMSSLLLGESAAPGRSGRDPGRDGVTSVRDAIIHLRTEHLGPDEIVVAAKLEFEHQLDVEHLATAIDEVEGAASAPRYRPRR